MKRPCNFPVFISLQTYEMLSAVSIFSQELTRSLIAPHTHQLIFIFIVTILGGMKLHLIIVLVCIFLMSNDVDCLF